MANWLTEIRKKPRYVRDNIAISAAGGFTLVLALIWFLAIGPEKQVATEKNDDVFATFLGQFKEQVATVNQTRTQEQQPMVLPGATSSLIAAPASTTASSTAASSTATSTYNSREVNIMPVPSASGTTPATRPAVLY